MASAMTLRELRQRADLTQMRLAHLLGVDRLTVSRWEQAITEPRPSEIPRIAWMLRATEEEVYGAIVRAKQTA